MTPRWLVMNALVLAIGAFFALQTVRTLGAVRPLPPEVPAKAAAPAPPKEGKEDPALARPALPTFSVVATKNLFNVSRSETTQAATGPAGQFPNLQLQGVIVTDAARIAYLEDPSTKRTHGYRIGDSIAAGRLERIESDRVFITRGEGSTVEVLLHDPNRPRSAPAPGAPATGATPPRPPFPGVVPPPPPLPPGVSQPGRPATPGFLRRPGGIPISPQQPNQPGPSQ